MTPKKQVDLWVDGESVHNNARDECCPDFSCCIPEIVTDLETKLKFKKAFMEKDFETVDKICHSFLADMLRIKTLEK